MSVSFDDSIADASTERAKVAEGCVRGVCTKAEVVTSKKKPQNKFNAEYWMLKLTFSLLEDPEDIESTTPHKVTAYQCLPFARDHWETALENGDLTTAEYKKLKKNLEGFSSGTQRTLNALLGDNEVPPTPKKDGGRWYYMDNEVEGDEIKEYTRAARKVAGARAAEYINNEDCSELEGTCAYFFVSYEKDATGEQSDFPSLNGFSSSVPVDDEGQEVEVLSGDGLIMAT